MLISNIVVADDGSDHAIAALEMAVDLTLKFDAKLTVVHVLTHDYPPEEMQHFIELEQLAPGEIAKERVVVVMGERIVKSAIKKATKSGVKDVSSVTRSGDYANCILEVAKEKNADMIVMGRRGTSELKGLLFGSVSHKVSQRADCSVLTVK
ncbi:MAG: universal stress protein [Amphritea sp.]